MKIRFVLVFLLSVLTKVFCDEIKCAEELSVDITDGTIIDGNIIKNGITYTIENYYQLDEKIFGCPCNITSCIRKCCADNEAISNKACESNNYDFSSNIAGHLPQDVQLDSFYLMHGLVDCPTKARFILDPNSSDDNFLIVNNGSLKWNIKIFEVDDYCLDYVVDQKTFAAILCSSVDTAGVIHTIGMIISMPFLLATFIVYAFLPDRNLPAKALMCYVISLLFAYIILVTIQLNSNHENSTCITLAFLCYFFFMASFFWMNASCLDIFFTFSGIRGLMGDRRKETRRFLYYCAYAWGAPVLLVCIVAIFTFLDSIDQGSSFYTGLGNGQCWFRSGWATGIYFYFPIATLLIINIVLFGVTTYKIKRVQRDTKMLKHVDSRKHKYDNNDKQRYDTDSDLVYLTEIELNENLQSDTINVYEFLEEEDSGCFRFNLYVKLLFAMGINWSMEVISWALIWKFVNIPDYVWVLTDFCNAVYGVFIFFIFVFKRNIWMLLKKRYLQITGRPQQAHTLTSTHRTTVSQVSSSEA